MGLRQEWHGMGPRAGVHTGAHQVHYQLFQNQQKQPLPQRQQQGPPRPTMACSQKETLTSSASNTDAGNHTLVTLPPLTDASIE